MKKLFLLLALILPTNLLAQTATFTPTLTPTPTLGINQIWYYTNTYTFTPTFTPTATLPAGTNTATPLNTRTATPAYTPTPYSTVITLSDYYARGMQIVLVPTVAITAIPNPASVGLYHAYWGRLAKYGGPNRRDAQLEAVVVSAIGATFTSTYTSTPSYTFTPAFTPTATLPAGTNTATPLNTRTATPAYTSTSIFTPTITSTPWRVNGRNLTGRIDKLQPNEIVVICGQRLYQPQPHVGSPWKEGQGFYFSTPGANAYYQPGRKSFMVFVTGLPTLTPTPTPTPTGSATPTFTPTPTGSWTAIPTATPTFTFTPSN